MYNCVVTFAMACTESTKIGFIGAGNMAQAVVKGLQSSGINIEDTVCLYARRRIQEKILLFRLQPLRKHRHRIRK